MVILLFWGSQGYIVIYRIIEFSSSCLIHYIKNNDFSLLEILVTMRLIYVNNFTLKLLVSFIISIVLIVIFYYDYQLYCMKNSLLILNHTILMIIVLIHDHLYEFMGSLELDFIN